MYEEEQGCFGFAGQPAEEPSQPAVPAPETAPSPQVPNPPRKRLGLRLALLAAGCALLGSLAGGAIVGGVMHHLQGRPASAGPEDASLAVQATEPLATEAVSIRSTATLTPAQIYERYVSGVVGVSNESTTMNVFGQPTAQASSGTGFLISAEGEILTNYHVVKGANRLMVTLYDGREYEAEVLGYEEISDVALIRIEADGLQPVRLGYSGRLKVGDPVAAIGNPLGELTYTMTVGYVSAMDRAINTDGTPINMMQIDAAINPGNSGGPLFDMQGNVVGINTAKYSGSTVSGASIEGIGFAIPIDDVKDILDDLRENGAVLDRAYIGVTVTDAKRSGSSVQGALVESVTEGSCGETAGLLPGDVIQGIDGYAVESMDSLSSALKHFRAGDTAELHIWRDGEAMTLPIVFDTRPQGVLTPEIPPTEESEPTDADEEPTEDGGDFEWTFPWNFLP